MTFCIIKNYINYYYYTIKITLDHSLADLYGPHAAVFNIVDNFSQSSSYIHLNLDKIKTKNKTYTKTIFIEEHLDINIYLLLI